MRVDFCRQARIAPLNRDTRVVVFRLAGLAGTSVLYQHLDPDIPQFSDYLIPSQQALSFLTT